MKRTILTEYITPSLDVCLVEAESGYIASTQYGDPGAAGKIEEGGWYEL